MPAYGRHPVILYGMLGVPAPRAMRVVQSPNISAENRRSRIRLYYVPPGKGTVQPGGPGSRRRWGRSRHTAGTGRAVFTPPYGA